MAYHGLAVVEPAVVAAAGGNLHLHLYRDMDKVHVTYMLHTCYIHGDIHVGLPLI